MNSNKGGTKDRSGLMACDSEWKTEPKSIQTSIVHASLSASCRNDFHWHTYFLARVCVCVPCSGSHILCGSGWEWDTGDFKGSETKSDIPAPDCGRNTSWVQSAFWVGLAPHTKPYSGWVNTKKRTRKQMHCRHIDTSFNSLKVKLVCSGASKRGARGAIDPPKTTLTTPLVSQSPRCIHFWLP